MEFHHFILSLTIYFLTAIVAVAASKKLGLGAIIGYLIAGVMVGPQVIGLVDHPAAVLQFSELGIVLLLFVIGLELSPRRLVKMRHAVFVAGGLQVAASGLLLAALAWLLMDSWAGAVVAGGALALSSTAFALQMLAEKKMLGSLVGHRAFGILLFQDLIVIPYLALMPLLAQEASESAKSVPLWIMLLAPVAIVTTGHYALNPLLTFFAALKVQDAFVALILALVIGFALLFEAIGYSMGLGAFVAGILLAESHFRHQVEATVEPFKGLLLGLFFVAVGMSVPLHVIADHLGLMLLIVALLLCGKIGVLLLLARYIGLQGYDRLYLALALAQGGEFAFVLFTQARQLNILPEQTVELLTAAVALSMIASQLLFSAWFVYVRRQSSALPFTPLEPVSDSGRVIIAGFGRFGQIVGRILSVQHVHYTAIDKDPAHLKFMRRFGNKVYFGNVTDMEVLQKAGIGQAELLVLAIDDIEESLEAVKRIREICPELPVIARAHNRMHAYQLTALGVKYVYREVFDTSLRTAQKVLERLGFPDSTAADVVRTFRDYDEESIMKHAALHGDMEKLIIQARQSREELQEIFDADAKRD
jgi:monovalent cation:proton antiporter-2 (CPA2) family protein